MEVLKGKFKSSRKGSWLRSGLVVFQFVISIILLIGTFIVYNQLQFIRQKQLGFNKEHLVVIHRARALGDQTVSFESTLKENPAVISTAATRHLPGKELDHNAFQPEDAPVKEVFLVMLSN